MGSQEQSLMDAKLAAINEKLSSYYSHAALQYNPTLGLAT